MGVNEIFLCQAYLPSSYNQANPTIFDKRKTICLTICILLQNEGSSTFMLNIYWTYRAHFLLLCLVNSVLKNQPRFLLYICLYCNHLALSIVLANWEAPKSKQEGIIFICREKRKTTYQLVKPGAQLSILFLEFLQFTLLKIHLLLHLTEEVFESWMWGPFMSRVPCRDLCHSLLSIRNGGTQGFIWTNIVETNLCQQKRKFWNYKII